MNVKKKLMIAAGVVGGVVVALALATVSSVVSQNRKRRLTVRCL
jgi:hypothetical protein